MSQPSLRILAFAAALLALAPSLHTPSLHAQTVQAVPVDETKLHGTWYEVARYPTKAERGCTSDITELIARSDKPHTLSFVDACRAKDDYMQTHNRLAKPDKHGAGKFRVTRLFLFHTQYWVLDVDPDYQWVVVGSPNHKTLWVFSRKPTLDPAAYDAILTKVAAEGFPKGPIIHTKQTPLPDPPVATTPPNAISPGPTPANPDKKK